MTARGLLSQAARLLRAQVLAGGYVLLLIGGLLAAHLVPLPVAQYDAVLVYCVIVTVVAGSLGWLTRRELIAMLAGYVTVMALAIVAVTQGERSYPLDGWAEIGGVPLLAGFGGAAVVAYVCRLWRLLAIEVEHFQSVTASAVAVLIYANFISRHWLLDIRALLAPLLLVVLRRCWVTFTLTGRRRRIPAALGYLATVLPLWALERLCAVLVGDGWLWSTIPVGSGGSWALLVAAAFLAVTFLKSREGTWYNRGAGAAVRTALDEH